MSLLAAYVLACIASFAEGAFHDGAYQRLQQAGRESYVSTLRIYSLGFKAFKPSTKYTVFLCDQEMKLVSLNANMAVVRITSRPAEADRCFFSIWDTEAEKRVYEDSFIEFIDKAKARPALDIVPSFYYADRPRRPRVRVTAPGARDISSVFSINSGVGDCTDVRMTPNGFSCVLPLIHTGDIDQAEGITFSATTVDESILFTVQALRDEGVDISSISPNTLCSKGRFTIRLARPLPSAALLPWAPVLSSGEPKSVVDSAVFRDVVFSEDRLTVEATVVCDRCGTGTFYLSLGEALPTMSAAVTPDNTFRVQIRSACGPADAPGTALALVAPAGAAEPEMADGTGIPSTGLIAAAAGLAVALAAVVAVVAWRRGAARKQQLQQQQQQASSAEEAAVSTAAYAAL
jgi:hypothetical protein